MAHTSRSSRVLAPDRLKRLGGAQERLGYDAAFRHAGQVEQHRRYAPADDLLVLEHQLHEDGADVLLDGPLRQGEILGDRAVALAARHQREHFSFARRELIEWRPVRPLGTVDELFNDYGIDDRAAARHDLERLD